MSYTLKLLICYHKKDVLLKDDVFTPIHVGRSLARERLGEDNPDYMWLEENMIGDDTGDNISAKNSSYNELTAVYWAWKNYDKLGNPDYIGLMHYRRHFIFRPSYDVVENVSGIDENYYSRINYNEDTLAHLFDDCDYVAHIGHVDEVFKHYSENHHIEDLELAISILKNKYPEYTETADAYLKMSYVNLCNMFIMPRKMYFEYCSWLFDILAEFESQVDLTDKRLFISERLTGIFIEYQKRKGFKQKALSATFIQSETHVPIVMPYHSDVFRTAVTMLSVMKRADKTTYADFYLLHKGDAKRRELEEFISRYPGNTIQFVNVKEKLGSSVISEFKFPEHYALVAAEVLDNIKKFIYMDEKAFIFGDIGKFYQACNNDEYAVLGLPADGITTGKEIEGNVFCLNGARLRRLRFMDDVRDNCAGMTSSEVFMKYAAGQVNTFPWWLYNVTDMEKDGRIYYDKPRGDQRCGVWDHCLLYYKDEMEPWKNIQGLYSVYWWNIASELPSCIPFLHVSDDAYDLFYSQSYDLCLKNAGRKAASFPVGVPSPATASNPNKKQGVLKRGMKYYKAHGFRQTVKKVWGKITRK
ncbi:MAG: DUF4422 domain-containing protein [Prevotella sp.]|nr:DUF4422 domain-containing protein [Prevotella sp.]